MQFRTSFNLLMPTRVNCFNFIGTLFPFHPLYCTFHSQCTPLAIAFSDIRISCDMKAWAKPYQESNQEMSGRKQRKFFHEPVWAFKIGNKVKIFPLWLMVLNTMPPTTCVVFNCFSLSWNLRTNISLEDVFCIWPPVWVQETFSADLCTILLKLMRKDINQT